MNQLVSRPNVQRPDHLLDADEKLIWWDTPYPRYYAQHPDPANIGYALFAVIFMIVWISIAFKSEGYFWLIGLVGLGYSIWLLAQPFLLYLEAPSVRYFLTDKRAVIAKKSTVKSIAIQSIGAIELRSEPEKLGDVLFLDVQILYGNGTRMVRDGFIGIANADAVAAEMRRLQAAAS